MKSKLAMSVGLLALLGLLGVTVAEMQTAETEAVQDAQPAVADTAPAAGQPVPDQAVEPSVLPEPAIDAPMLAPPPAEATPPSVGPLVQPRARVADLEPARGLYFHIRPDGTTVGRVKAIDRSTLLLKPVVGALVSFLQDRKIVAQGLTDEHGTFAVRGLTPWGVYSITMSASDSVCMFAVVVLPPENDGDRAETSGAAEKGVGVTPGWVNEIRFTSLAEDSDDGSSGHSEVNDFQVIPREDFLAALRAGLFGSDTGGLPPAGMLPGGGTGMGGGGGGAGGGGGGGLGGALIGAGIGAGIGAALGGDDEDNVQASPFAP